MVKRNISLRISTICCLCILSFIAGNIFDRLFSLHGTSNNDPFLGPPSLTQPNQRIRTPRPSYEQNLDVNPRSLANAVNTLRCLTTPGCYPSVRCEDGSMPMKIKGMARWEEHSFCISDLLPPPPSSELKNKLKASMNENDKKCLVYSFGLDKSTKWEEKMASLFHCEVFAFDPTSSFPEIIAPGVTFHKLGLQGAGTNVSMTHSVNYDAIDPSKLRTLGEIVKMMGHENRKIDVLRLDCEGCEYGVLKQLACNGDSQMVKQLMVEFHFQKNIGFASDADLLVAADAITCLEGERWGIVSMEKRGCGESDAEYIDSALKIIKGPLFLLFLTFRRIPPEKELGWEMNGRVVVAAVEKLKVTRKNLKAFGKMQDWPKEIRNEYFTLNIHSKHLKDEYNNTFDFRPIEFDSFEAFQQDEK